MQNLTPDPLVHPAMSAILRDALGRLIIREKRRLSFLRPDEIDWLEACGDYVRVHAGTGRFLIRSRMRAVETEFASERFIRIHRSAIVNSSRIKELLSNLSGDAEVVLVDGTRLAVSRSQKMKAIAFLLKKNPGTVIPPPSTS